MAAFGVSGGHGGPLSLEGRFGDGRFGASGGFGGSGGGGGGGGDFGGSALSAMVTPALARFPSGDLGGHFGGDGGNGGSSSSTAVAAFGGRGGALSLEGRFGGGLGGGSSGGIGSAFGGSSLSAVVTPALARFPSGDLGGDFGGGGGSGCGGGGGALPFKDSANRRDVTEKTHGRGVLFATQASALDPGVIAAAGGIDAFLPRLGPDATGADNMLWRCPGTCAGCTTAARKNPGGPGCVNKRNGIYLNRAVCAVSSWCTCQRPFAYSESFNKKSRKK